MDWETIRDNLGIIIFAAIWLLSFLMRAARGTDPAGRPAGPLARRRRARRRAVILGFALMALAIGAWELSQRQSGEEAAFLRIAALVLATVAVLAVLIAGFTRPGSAVQGTIAMPTPDERAEEIQAGEPLEPS